jgi:aminoglycoside phosphotransferase family enzyme/predicted kinase
VDRKADLLRVEAYGPLGPRTVELAETHISWVFLLDHDVFKVKKPMNLGFLDFTSQGSREAACRAEVALNARLAQGVYRGVVPLREDSEGRASLSASAGGPIVDWAVHMRRLPDERRADVLLAKGELGRRDIDAIAARLARFHSGVERSARIASFGSPQAIARNVEENFAQTRGVIETYVPAEGREILEWQSAFVRDHAALFERRAATGHVRDGHGDLRLEHIYLEKVDDPTIIDCIEFNERFRFADVCADIAFLSMDLEASSRVDLAEHLLSRYARETNDFDLFALVDFYESYRAFVRAKVATIVAASGEVGEMARRRAAEDARRHFLLALAEDRRSLLLPAVVAVAGVIASGKSTVAEHIADEMSAPVVEADRTRKSMLGVAPTQAVHETAWSGAYDPGFTDEVYAEVIRRAEVVLASGRPVVLDASFRSRASRERARKLAADRGVPFRLIECRANADACRARLAERERRGGVSDGRLAIFDAFCARFEPIVELPGTEHIAVDTEQPLEDTLNVLRALIATWPQGFVA